MYANKLDKLIISNPEVAHNRVYNYIQIEKLVCISFLLKILKLVLVMLNLAFLLAMFWYTGLKFVEDFVYGVDYSDECMDHIYKDEFINYYKLGDKSNEFNLIILVYFAFTTLTTVGFGDYAPRSDIERAVWSIILVIGVATFSLILSEFIKIIGQVKSMYEEFSAEDDQLRIFLSVLKRFNHNKPIH